VSDERFSLDFEELKDVFILLKGNEDSLTDRESRLFERIRDVLYTRFSIEEMEAFESRYERHAT
jgi:hypothetical protein